MFTAQILFVCFSSVFLSTMSLECLSFTILRTLLWYVCVCACSAAVISLVLQFIFYFLFHT